jgi:hypothetical protein
MDEWEVRLACLAQAERLVAADKVIERARELSDFVVGRRDAEIIGAARWLAEKIG